MPPDPPPPFPARESLRPMLAAAATGFATGLSLILAIGAQNAFVLRQGLARSHVLWVCLVCAVSDAVLIAAGVAGVGALMRETAWIETAMRWAGAAFLFWYGAQRLRAARTPEALTPVAGRVEPLGPTLIAALAITWANPHVYLDTLVLIGAVGSGFEGAARWAYAGGAITASFAFFFGLGYGARYLAPILATPRAWSRIEVTIGLTMWAIAAMLLAG